MLQSWCSADPPRARTAVPSRSSIWLVNFPGYPLIRGADDGIRTRDPHLGKVMRYQLRYIRIVPLGDG